MKHQKLILTIALAAIAVPAARAGTDTGIGIPAGRDAANSVAAVPKAPVSEKTAGLWTLRSCTSARPGSMARSIHGRIT